jgi:hypothetical protein
LRLGKLASPCLRDRYTSFDLAYELGMEREMVAAIASARRENGDRG